MREFKMRPGKFLATKRTDFPFGRPEGADDVKTVWEVVVAGTAVTSVPGESDNDALVPVAGDVVVLDYSGDVVTIDGVKYWLHDHRNILVNFGIPR